MHMSVELHDEHGDVANREPARRIDEAEKRTWFLFKASQRADTPGR
jgi:hypothetical protein